MEEKKKTEKERKQRKWKRKKEGKEKYKQDKKRYEKNVLFSQNTVDVTIRCNSVTFTDCTMTSNSATVR